MSVARSAVVRDTCLRPARVEGRPRASQEGLAMTQSPAYTSTAVASAHGRLRRSAPLIAGAIIAPAGLPFGSVSVASARAERPSPPPTIEQQAAAVKAQDAYTRSTATRN